MPGLLKALLPARETIGPEECPIVYRWTLAEFGRRVDEGSGPSRRFKVLLHHFQPNVEHRHRTRVLLGGAWTLVLMGPIKRPWGFWPDGRFMPWREYRAIHGDGMRCA